MYIHEAVKKALKENGVICRESIYREHAERYAVIKPTDSYDTCMLIVCYKGKAERSSRAWNPTADDLKTNDWTVLRNEF